MDSSILARQDRVHLDNGMDLRLLSALEVLQARREAGELACEDRERALCSNACLLARALERTENHTPVFPDGQSVLAGLTVEEIGALAARWAREMKGRDDLGCLVHTLLDREDELERFCPECRSRGAEERCPVCGRPASSWAEGSVNISFDMEKFEQGAGKP